MGKGEPGQLELDNELLLALKRRLIIMTIKNNELVPYWYLFYIWPTEACSLHVIVTDHWAQAQPNVRNDIDNIYTIFINNTSRGHAFFGVASKILGMTTLIKFNIISKQYY